ncbi:MAG: hypothetical protein HY078_04045 [Elusimicrobia bacterium]|nr:hypothetical protein [Elusimicrobiota bacterium]
MSAPTDFSAEWTSFLSRLGLIGALLAGFGLYAASPKAPDVPSGRARRATQGAPASVASLAGTGGAPAGDPQTLRKVVEALSEGRPSPELEKALADAEARGDLDKPFNDGATFKNILSEARQGSAGPAIERAIAAADARGDLDRVKVMGKSLKQYMSEAKELSARADELKAKTEREMAEANGIKLDAEDPRDVARQMAERLKSPLADDRLLAAQTLCDLRYAANADPALRDLEALAQDPDVNIRDAAALALKRFRFCNQNAPCRSKYRKG